MKSKKKKKKRQLSLQNKKQLNKQL